MTARHVRRTPAGTTVHRLPAWLARWARRFLALPVVLSLGAAADAQAPRSIINKTTINLPILLDNSVRPYLKEVQLYVKENAAAPWILKEKVAPTQTFFTYRAPGEGEYSFNVMTLDRTGKTVPADINKEQPALTVVVDLTSPQVNLRVGANTPNGQIVHVEAQDPNYDPLKTSLAYQTGDRVWRPLDCQPGAAEQFCIPSQAVLTGMVRVAATDKAGNTTTKEFNVNAMITPVAAAPIPPMTPTIPVTPKTPPQGTGVVMVETGGTTHVLTPPPARPVETAKLPTPIKIADGLALPPSLPLLPDLPRDVPLKDRVELVHRVESPSIPPPGPALNSKDGIPAKSISVEVPPPSAGPGKIVTLPSKLNVRDVPAPGLPGAPSILKTAATPSAGPRESLPPNCHIASSTRVYLDYKIEDLGASGVGRVEVWMTSDRGQSWQKIGEDKNLKSPAEVNLPGEGVFGVSLVVTNGRGFGGTPPQPGDQADYWIEVDVTRPSGEITGVRPSGADDGSLVVTWNARDKKLATEPIDLYFSTTREGPWTSIAKGVQNDGSYRWVPPRDVAAHAYLRMMVHDQAGNTFTCETANPVALDDLSRPRGRVLGVSTTPKTGLPDLP